MQWAHTDTKSLIEDQLSATCKAWHFHWGHCGNGRGTLLAKFNVESAYRNVAVHPKDHPLLGMKWSRLLSLLHGWFSHFGFPPLRSALITCTLVFSCALVWAYPCILISSRGLPHALLYSVSNWHQSSFKHGFPLKTSSASLPYCICGLDHLHHEYKINCQGWIFLWQMINLLFAFQHDDHSIKFNHIWHGGRSFSTLGMAWGSSLRQHGLPIETSRSSDAVGFLG